MTALQTNFYRWMEVVIQPNHTFLIRPRSDENEYEQVVDYQFDTSEAAHDWRNQELDVLDFDDTEEIVYVNSWVLVHTVNTVVGDDAFED